MDGREIGNLGGALIGGMATGEAIGASIRHQRNLRTIQEWSRALDSQRTGRIKA